MFNDVDQLFAAKEIPGDETSCLGQIADMLAEFSPSLIVLVNCNGQVIAADQVGVASHGREIATVATGLAAALRTQHSCFFEHVGRKGGELAFGVRLSTMTVGSLLGGLVAPRQDAHERLESMSKCLAACGNLAWQTLEERASVKRMNARKDQLRIELETLRSSHVNAVARALEEQQKRIDAECLYSQRLQREVDVRSAELQQALEDANRKSQELLENALALENANVTLEFLIQEANAANAAKSRFLAMMSHEIRTPMTAILGYTELLRDELPPAGIQKDRLAIIQHNGRQLLDIIDDILDLSKIESGKLQVVRSVCTPAQVLAEVVSLLQVRANSKGLVLKREYTGPCPATVTTDATRFRQILVNLIGNAIKFTEQGEVRIFVRLIEQDTPAPKLACEVVDTGIGMTNEQVKGLFQPFCQGDNAVNRKSGGTGLGLAISRHLARLLGGDITVSTEPGKGSKFTVTIDAGPLENVALLDQPDEVALQLAPTVPPSGPLPGPVSLNCRILLAEDGLDNQRLISFLLRKAGAEVVAVEDGNRALDLALATLPGHNRRHDDPTRPFDVILMDMQMPVMDGYTATRRLRELGHKGPIIALTAHALAEDRQKCLDMGCDDYLTKPIDRQKLMATVAHWVSRAASDRTMAQDASLASAACGAEESPRSECADAPVIADIA
jgi:signal transduction histidine kinase/FixJ family two-component response regulator